MDPYELVRGRVRVRAGYLAGGGVHAEGIVVGYLDQPSLLIQQDDGSRVHVAISCPLTVLDQGAQERNLGQ